MTGAEGEAERKTKSQVKRRMTSLVVFYLSRQMGSNDKEKYIDIGTLNTSKKVKKHGLPQGIDNKFCC